MHETAPRTSSKAGAVATPRASTEGKRRPRVSGHGFDGQRKEAARAATSEAASSESPYVWRNEWWRRRRRRLVSTEHPPGVAQARRLARRDRRAHRRCPRTGRLVLSRRQTEAPCADDAKLEVLDFQQRVTLGRYLSMIKQDAASFTPAQLKRDGVVATVKAVGVSGVERANLFWTMRTVRAATTSPTATSSISSPAASRSGRPVTAAVCPSGRLRRPNRAGTSFATSSRRPTDRS